MRPEIHLTVIVHTPFFTNPAQQVLVQGWLLNTENVGYLLEFIEKQLNLLEKKIALVSGMANQQLEAIRAESDQLVGGLFEEAGSNIAINAAGSMVNVSMVSPEVSFINMLRYGMLALALLPEHSCAHLIVISDGIVGVTDIHVLDSVVQQLRATTVACSFIHLGSAYHPHCANGLVPYEDLLSFIATATLGTYMPFVPQDTPAFGGEMNMYHRNFICWQLYRNENCEPSAEPKVWRTGNSLFYGHQRPQLLRKKQIDDKVTCSLSSLLCCRLRDGYLIKRVAIRDGLLEICFTLPWKSHVYLEYLASTSWPSKSLAASNTVQYTITIEAPYEFLHDITCLSKKPLKSQYRQSVVSRFWSALTALTENDNMLAHFSWFPELGWTWYNVSDTIRSGMPVFYLPSYPSAGNSVQLSEAACPQFGKIWKPVVSLDPQQWARWMHSQKITLILSHDRPLPKYLHQANQSGRFQCVQCRQAAAVLYAMLKNWSTFVLVENHTYVQFIYREAEKPPVSFSVIRINCKALCVVLNVAFSGGTEGVVRHNVVVDLLERLSKLTLPNRPTEQNETPCCAIIHKALERILIRYERVPIDLNTVIFPDDTQPMPVRGTQIPGGVLTTTLSRYLYHNRWLWNVKKPLVQTVPGIVLPRLNTTAIARILSTITKMRLAEGFSFAYSSAGIINMVMEIQMRGTTDNCSHTCTIQYVLFPPHVITNPTLDRDSDSDDDTDEGTADGEVGNEENEGSGDFQIVTEVWIEPQCGQAKLPAQPTASYIDNLTYHQLPDAISLVDEECINALLTLEHLSLLSQVEPSENNSEINNGYQYQASQYGQTNGWLSSSRIPRQSTMSEGLLEGLPIPDQKIHPMFFNFDTLSILPKCHQAELLYSMFADGPNYTDEERDDANSILMDILLEHMKRLHSKELLFNDRESQRFTEMLLARPRDDGPSLPFSPYLDKKARNEIRWRCFVKGVSVTHVIITMIPASDKDVKSIMSSCENSGEDIVRLGKTNELLEALTPIREMIDERTRDSFSSGDSPRKSKMSTDLRMSDFDLNTPSLTTTAESTPKVERRRNVFPSNAKPRLILPVYVYDCSLSLLIEVLINKARSSRIKDTYEDHTFTLGEQVREDYVNLKSGNDVKPTSPEPKSEDSDNLSNDQRSLMEHCKLLSLAHCHCYVVAVYKSLALQLPLSYEDMEAAVEQCEEALIEINITDYLRTVCRHLGNSSNTEWSTNLGSSMCVDAQPLHNLIKEKFRRIITVAFEPVPAHPEFYYCSPSHNSDRMDQMEYQRSDSEDDLEGFMFHSETNDCKMENPSGKANQVTNATWPASNVAHDETKRPCYDSTESLISDLREDINRTKEQPLFLQLSCSVHVRSTLSSVPVKLLPTCLTEIRQCLDDYLDCNSDDFKITLDIICLNLPKDVLEINLERGNGPLRTTSFRSSSPAGSARTESESSPGNDTQNSENEPARERIDHLPLHQHHAITILTSEIEWLLKDEIATALLDKSPPSEETLKFVAQHVSDSNDRPSCHKDKVPLQFVYSSNNSSPKFYEELQNLRIDRYSIRQTSNFFYLIKNPVISETGPCEESSEISRNENEEPTGKEDKTGGIFLDMDDPTSVSHDANSRTSKQDSGDPPGCNSEISSIGDGHPGTDDGYEGDSSNSEDDCNWLVDLDEQRTLLPNFWLILQVNNDNVDIYFHCRFLEFVSLEVDRYRQVQKMVVAQITAICRRVNQYLLLESLNDTKNCDSLLEAESPEDPSWRGESTTESAGLIPNNENASSMTPGMFRCPSVWQVTFCLHPHLKTGPGRSGLSRGIKALHGVLNRFSVNNRSNMFVYRENKANVFYLRLHEQTSNGKPLQNKLSESDERLMVSRSSSVASLSQARATSLRVDQTKTADTRPRVRSFGEKDSDYLNKSDDSIVLVVHGISEPGLEIKKELIQVLQNRLDDAVLEVVSVMLARNPMCKLTPADVHFIQKPYRSPESYIQLSVQPHCLPHMDALAYYLRQNILQFLYIPKYTDPRAHYHLQDYSQPEGSSLRVVENDIFLYNQSHSSGSRGIACIALAIADSSVDQSLREKRDFPAFLRIQDFEKIVSTTPYEAENRSSSVPGAPIEFRIWKQGRVNLDTLVDKLRSAIKHATWDLITEYNLLPTALTTSENDDEKCERELKTSEENTSGVVNEEFDNYELGEEGNLHEIYHMTMAHWFQFALEMGVSSVKKHIVNFQNRHSIPTILKELQNLIRTNAPDTATRAFVLRTRQPFVLDELLPADGLLAFNPTEISTENDELRATVVTTDGTVQPLVYVPCNLTKESTETYTKSIIVARNFNQWKSTFSKTVESEILVPKDQKLLQKFNPLIQESKYVPRQRLLLAKIQNDNFVLYMYNWSKERSEKLIKQATNLGTWLSSRSTLLTNITMQKLGIFHHQPVQQTYRRDESGSQYCQNTDIESLVKFTHVSSTDGKEWSRAANRGQNLTKIGPHHHSWDRIAGQSLRDAKPNPHYPQNVDSVVKAAYDLQDVQQREKKSKEELTRLYAMWQSRSSGPNIPISSVNLCAFKQHSRLIHYCHTPLLFLPQWRLQSAATRDHSLTPVSSLFPSALTQHQLSQQSPWKMEPGSSSKDNILTAWHQQLCTSMLNEYKQYLQVLGFNPVQIDEGRQDDTEPNHSQNYYLKKSMLGGVLLFEIHLAEPFFIAKLRIVECSRLQTKASSALVNQFMLSFVDACDKIKVNMHLHSFTYDFHLRCIHSYIAGTGQWSLQQGYHLTRFLDDFVKYYSKAPNYARNLVHSDVITVSNLTTPAQTLYSYLLSHEKTYGMQVFGMAEESLDSRDSEYVLVRLQSTSLVSYCDSQDTKYTDDFDVALIVSRLEQPAHIEKSEITLKYYLMLTSKRELYPKREVENNKLGKFRTVYNVERSETSSQSDSVPEYNSNSQVCQGARKNSVIEGNLSGLNEDSQESIDSTKCENSWPEDERDGACQSVAPTPPPVPSSLIQNTGPSVTPETTSSPHPGQIRQESINYLGYYSSHEQLMQQLITTQARTARDHITDMIERGSLHCRTHLLWNKLLENKSTMNYTEFMELRSLARVEPLSSIDSRLNPLVNQPISWYQGLAKVLQNKYQEHHKQFNSPDGSVTHHLILHPSYLQAFMMLTIDLQTSRGELYAVYRKSAETSITPFNVNEVYSLVEGFVNACCFHLWIGLYSQ
ncbi:KICSTOR complex protein SZT2-like isoform X2 [Venturia canescens]|nr:KICSTOR complex protein SZT2-like isoform X2 [Venturia canescens]